MLEGAKRTLLLVKAVEPVYASHRNNCMRLCRHAGRYGHREATRHPLSRGDLIVTLTECPVVDDGERRGSGGIVD